ncbi:MAG: tetratricopeptide repeat protein [Bilophila wadsworthia]
MEAKEGRLVRRFHLPEQSWPHLRAGDTRQGVLYHQEAVSIRKEILGIHPETAFSLGNCGAALAGDAQWEKAAQTLEEALSCYESLGLSDSPEAVTCRNNLNLCRNAVKQSAAQ